MDFTARTEVSNTWFLRPLRRKQRVAAFAREPGTEDCCVRRKKERRSLSASAADIRDEPRQVLDFANLSIAAQSKVLDLNIGFPTRNEIGDDSRRTATHRPAQSAVSGIQKQISNASLTNDRGAIRCHRP